MTDNAIVSTLNKAVVAFDTAFRGMDEKDIEKALAVVRGWSSSNCYFVNYGLKDGIIKLLEGRLVDLKLTAKKSESTN